MDYLRFGRMVGKHIGNIVNEKKIKEIVNHQAEMDSLWFTPETIGEHILISALRHLHAVIEGDEKASELAKRQYWNMEG